MEKPHGIRKHGKASVYYMRAECSECGGAETLACYEENISNRKFALGFLECPNCFSIFCADCRGGLCPKCGDIKLRELTPAEVYRCNICFLDEEASLCRICKYPHLKKRKKTG